ncbi:Protein of unknown function [Escherichia coli D6-113.11]|nr:Protein of unknown function [Escherichia coli D6-113.11]CDU35562.1 Protein of unknown function [Escherichia coli D6-113.11]
MLVVFVDHNDKCE